jgi:phenylacetate-CoA ligase
MRRMEKITGRSDDMMIVRGVNVFPTQIEDLILKVPGLAPHYQIVLTREARMDEMQVLVEASAKAASAEARVASASELQRLVKNLIGVSAEINVAEPGGIERSQGKARRIIDKRPKAG